LAIPVFILGAAVATALASVARRIGWRASPFVLGLESLLLACLLVITLIVPDMHDFDQSAVLVAGLCGLCAMGVQSAFVRLLMRDAPSTNVMTTNTTQVAIDATEVLLARVWGGRSTGLPPPADIQRARQRLTQTVPIVLAFLAGTIVGAVACHRVGFVCLVLPVALLTGLTIAASRRAIGPQ
jgi:uncharacterized membrane protein YoaK (UPF0700 family)